MDYNFGKGTEEDPMDYNAFIMNVIEGAPPYRMNSTDIELYLREVYDLQFGIRVLKDDDSKTLDAIGFHEPENIFAGSSWEDKIRDFLVLKIREQTGYTFNEWMDLPRWVQDMFIASMSEIAKENKNYFDKTVGDDLK